MEDLNELKERVAALELHRGYDTKALGEVISRLNDVVDKQEEIYIGLRWLTRIGKFFAGVTAVILTIIGIKNGVTPNG